jgi:hypothetical protein
MLTDAIVARLSAWAPLVQLLGSSAGAPAVYPVRLPQAPALPAVTYLDVSAVDDLNTSGASGLRFARVQIDCWASTYASGKAVLAEVRRALHSLTGSMAAGVSVQLCEVGGDRTSFYADVALYTASADAEVWFEERTG